MIHTFGDISFMFRIFEHIATPTFFFNIEKINNVNLIKAEVYDINGRFIKSVDLANMNTTKAIDLSQAASGIYFMTITTNKAKGVIRLIKQ